MSTTNRNAQQQIKLRDETTTPYYIYIATLSHNFPSSKGIYSPPSQGGAGGRVCCGWGSPHPRLPEGLTGPGSRHIAQLHQRLQHHLRSQRHRAPAGDAAEAGAIRARGRGAHLQGTARKGKDKGWKHHRKIPAGARPHHRPVGPRARLVHEARRAGSDDLHAGREWRDARLHEDVATQQRPRRCRLSLRGAHRPAWLPLRGRASRLRDYRHRLHPALCRAQRLLRPAPHVHEETNPAAQRRRPR